MKKIPALILIGLLAAATSSAAVITSSSDPAFEKLHKGKKITWKLKKVVSKNKAQGDTVAIDILENGVSISDGTVSPPPVPAPNPPFINIVDLKPGTRTDVGQSPNVGPWIHVTCPDKNPPKEVAKDAKPQPKPHLQIFGAAKGGTIEIEIDEAEQKDILRILKEYFKF